MPLVAGIYLECPVSAWLCIGEQDLTKFIRFVIAQKFAVPIDGKRDIGHRHHIFSIIFDDT